MLQSANFHLVVESNKLLYVISYWKWEKEV